MFCGIILGVLQVVEAFFKVQFHFQKMCGPIENVNQTAVIWKSFEVCDSPKTRYQSWKTEKCVLLKYMFYLNLKPATCLKRSWDRGYNKALSCFSHNQQT